MHKSVWGNLELSVEGSVPNAGNDLEVSNLLIIRCGKKRKKTTRQGFSIKYVTIVGGRTIS